MDFRGIINSRNEPLQTALESLPGYTEAIAAMHRVRAYIRSANADDSTTTTATLIDEVVAAATSDDLEPVDLESRAFLAEQIEPRRKARLTVLDEAATRFEFERDRLISQGRDNLFKSLHSQLRDVVSDFDKLAPDLGDISSAEAAIAADKVDVWRQAELVGKRHDDIRSAQARLMGIFAGGGTPWRGGHSAIENLDAVWPEWIVWKRAGALINPRTRAVTRLEVPWPNGGGINYLRWVKEVRAQMWVPTPTQLDDHEKAVTAEAQERWYGKPTYMEQRTTTEPADDGRLVPTDARAAAG